MEQIYRIEVETDKRTYIIYDSPERIRSILGYCSAKGEDLKEVKITKGDFEK